MFLRSSKAGGRTYWRVVESYREGGKPKHRTIHNLGPHETRAQADAAWFEILTAEIREVEEARRQAERGPKAKPSPEDYRGAADAFASFGAFDPSYARSFAERMNEYMDGGPYRPHGSPPPALGILGVGPDATLDHVKAAWRRLAAENHPDRGGDPAKMAAINDAYEKALERFGAGKRSARP